MYDDLVGNLYTSASVGCCVERVEQNTASIGTSLPAAYILEISFDKCLAYQMLHNGNQSQKFHYALKNRRGR